MIRPLKCPATLCSPTKNPSGAAGRQTKIIRLPITDAKPRAIVE
jgi:hypothetical protein